MLMVDGPSTILLHLINRQYEQMHVHFSTIMKHIDIDKS